MKVRPSGDANCYWLLSDDGKEWIAEVRLNGEIAGEHQDNLASQMSAASDLLEALERASRKLSAYVGVCAGDKELTDTVLPMVRAAIAKAKGES